jgi:hypothetical protein
LHNGGYWLTLEKAVTAGGNVAYWGEDDGNSQAQDSALGTIGSESFQILGASGTIYDNGSDPGNILAYAINSGYAVTNSFTI